MVTFLLFISFLLNIISLLSVVILYSRQNRFLNMEKDQKKILAEMEDVISTYLVEMKEQNDEFIRSFKTQDYKSKQVARPTEENDQHDSPQYTKTTKWTGTGYKRASQAYQQMHEDKTVLTDRGVEMPVEPDQDPLIQQVISMKKKGMSIEEIAKSVGKGKTEIELLLKFRQIM
ncbi:hypothetical protein CN378_10090 [Bacillus sp. AFS015802]|uniref:hypothetical protein n=1 Tax=Bacillus sp. AFS015802 TaxID=2033486 RepID=UPI000BF99EE5|nr:hypothetical protein [Bacillus sp. AFS015802]PFA67857.1 hypothetical protein CN378_10090 [Bacillus sp. AFS015802]